MSKRKKDANYSEDRKDDVALTIIRKHRYTINKNLALQIESTHCPFKVYRKKNTKQRHTDEDDSEMKPTNAFGQMEFIGGESKTRAKYIRLSDKTDFEEIEALMRKSWYLKFWPKTVISVIGGMRNFKLEPEISQHLKKEIHKLCMKIANMSSETWVITKGTDYGVTKLVTEGMKGNKYKNTRVIGVTLWEKLKGKNDLKQSKDSIKIPRYSVKKATNHLTDEGYYLNKDHTHFFLVDTPPNDENCTEKEIVFRHQFVRHIIFRQLKELEKFKPMLLKILKQPNKDYIMRTIRYIYKIKKDTEIKFGPEEIFVPAIQLVINGGLRTLSQIKKNLYPEDGGEQPVIMPVVVVARTGRVADWLTFAVENSDTRLNELLDKIKKISPQNYIQIFNDIILCLQRKQFITIYHPFISKSLEDTIVRTFTMTRRLRNDSYITFDQLKMTMRWGREDIAEEEFLKVMSDKKVENSQISGVMKKLFLGALHKEKMSFFNMILRIYFDIRMFDKDMLMGLYEQVYLKDRDKHKNVLFTFLPPPKSSIIDLEANPKTKMIVRANEMNILDNIRKEISKLISINIVDYYNQETFELSDAEKELFLWAILCNKQKVAIALWKHGDDPIAKALIARRMYKRMASRYKNMHPFFDEHVYKNLQTHARYFECEALNLLEKCSSVSSSQAAQLMVVKMPRWMDKSCMDLAALSDFEQFVAHQRCQDITELTWKGDFALYGRYLNVKVLSGVLFPPIILLLEFKDTYRHKEKFCCNATSSAKRFVCITRSIVDKFYAFYNAPVTKFWRNAIFYIFFLLIFCYILLNTIRTELLYAEYIVMLFIVAFGMDELRSIIEEPTNSYQQKVHEWWADQRNKIDFMAILLYTIAFTIRLCYGKMTSVSHFIYALDFLIWTIRLLRLISLHKKIGVYVSMLRRMIGNIIYFVVIIFVFVVGYGIARTSILYPKLELRLNEYREQGFLSKIFLKPFFHVVGEMFINTEITSKNVTIFQTPIYNKESEAFMIILQLGYIVITNLLFINLLIAVFNNTYEAVRDNSDRIWKWNYYKMVKEYQAGSILPAPFSIFSNIFFLSKSLWKKIIKRTRQNEHKREKISLPKFISMAEYFEKDTHMNTMKQFENECLSKYLIEKNEYIQNQVHLKLSLSGANKYSPNDEHTFSQRKELDAGLIMYGSDNDD